MSDKVLIVTPDEKIITTEYDGLKSLQKAVGGYIELFHYMTFRFDFVDKKIKTVLFCNEEFLVTESEEFNKINAFASLVSQKEIRGNIVIIADLGDGEDGGFSSEKTNGTYSDCELMIMSLQQYFETNKKALSHLHNSFDNRKSDPKRSFVISDKTER